MLSSLANGLRVLEFVAERREVGVSEVARELGLTVGTAHRLVATLVGSGFVEQNPTNRRYHPSSKLAELARMTRGEVDFVAAAHPYLERLQAETGETTNLGVLRDDMVVYIDRAVTDQPLAVAVKVGSRVPAYCTSLGRILLAYAPDGVRERYLRELRRIAAPDPQRAPSRKELAAILDEVVASGYAEDDGEFSADIACFAAPVLDGTGRAVAAISVSGPRSRIRARSEELINDVRAAAERLTDLLRDVGAEAV